MCDILHLKQPRATLWLGGTSLHTVMQVCEIFENHDNNRTTKENRQQKKGTTKWGNLGPTFRLSAVVGSFKTFFSAKQIFRSLWPGSAVAFNTSSRERWGLALWGLSHARFWCHFCHIMIRVNNMNNFECQSKNAFENAKLAQASNKVKMRRSWSSSWLLSINHTKRKWKMVQSLSQPENCIS